MNTLRRTCIRLHLGSASCRLSLLDLALLAATSLPIGPGMSLVETDDAQDKWAKNLYIAGVAYGRTVS